MTKNCTEKDDFCSVKLIWAHQKTLIHAGITHGIAKSKIETLQNLT